MRSYEIITPLRRNGKKTMSGIVELDEKEGEPLVAIKALRHADRKASALLVQSAWLEETTAFGARRRAGAEVASALTAELRLMCEWLGLADVVVKPVGSLALQLAQAHVNVDAAGNGT